jgi:hypothetical protein
MTFINSLDTALSSMEHGNFGLTEPYREYTDSQFRHFTKSIEYESS